MLCFMFYVLCFYRLYFIFYLLVSVHYTLYSYRVILYKMIIYHLHHIYYQPGFHTINELYIYIYPSVTEYVNPSKLFITPLFMREATSQLWCCWNNVGNKIRLRNARRITITEFFQSFSRWRQTVYRWLINQEAREPDVSEVDGLVKCVISFFGLFTNTVIRL